MVDKRINSVHQKEEKNREGEENGQREVKEQGGPAKRNKQNQKRTQ